MRLALLSASSQLSPRGAALVSSISQTGHTVSVARRRQGRFVGERFECDTIPEVIWPEHSTLLEAADRYATRVGGWVARRPDWPVPRRDHMQVVPDVPALSIPYGTTPPERAPWNAHRGLTPQDRHSGRRVMLVYRSTPSSPGHYLRNALLRAGVAVTVASDADMSAGEDVDAIVVVEGPTPPVAFERHRGVPVVFWVHHGEHHLDGNLRLARRYGADLVLMAHSWHLALRFATRVERFPFAVAPELGVADFDPDRRVDMAFVGAIEGTAYARRRLLLEAARAALPEVEVSSGMSPGDMSALYRRSKAVLNEGGTRHRPITMRVFETVGAGALLVTESPPGLDLLFPEMYAPIPADGLDGQKLAELLSGPAAAERARAAHHEAMEAHTYDHRVDLLFRLLEDVRPGDAAAWERPEDPLERFLADHPYVQRILDATGALEAPGYEVVATSSLRADPAAGGYDLVLLDRSSPPELAVAARRFVVGRHVDLDRLPLTPAAVFSVGDLTIVDTGAPAYDERTVGGPAAV